MKYSEIKLYNPGILIGEMPGEVFTELKQSCDKQMEAKSVNQALKRTLVTDYFVQGIEEVLYISIPKSYDEYLCNFALEFCKHFNMKIEGLEPRVKHNWLNLQKKYEYRPFHAHADGPVGLSFVTYIKVPYDLVEEDAFSNHTKRATRFRNGRIEFIYSEYGGLPTSYTVDVDKTFESKTLLFINSFHHLVYPFYTSDEYRISLAGNISFN